MNQTPPAMAAWDGMVNGEHSSHLGRHPGVNPVLRQAPIQGYSLSPTTAFHQGSAPPFTLVGPTDGQQAFPTRVPIISAFGQDAQHRRMGPIRRPAHWEDNPYAGSSLYHPGLQAHGHRCCSVACYDYDIHGSCRSGCSNHWRPSEFFPGSNHLQHTCPHSHWNSYDPSARRSSTLTYIGPPTETSCPSWSPTPSLPSQKEDRIHSTHDNKRDQSKEKGGRKKNWRSAVRGWLDKHLLSPKSNSLKLPKTADEVKKSEITPQALNRTPSMVNNTSGIRRVSPSSTRSTAVASHLRPSDLSPTPETIASSSSPDHPPDNPILTSPPRPPSTVSTCQCLPLESFALHKDLQHDYHAQPNIDWDITRSPTIISQYGLNPELLNELATTPPMRHMFINSIADFPLERCQGDPDPQRCKDRSQHLYRANPDNPTSDLIEKRTLPWPIRITGSAKHGYITLKDVLQAIYANFQEYIPNDEYDQYTMDRKRLMTAAYHIRQHILEIRRQWPHGTGFHRSAYHEDRVEEGFMRCDYLGSQLMFRGLEISPDEEGYSLFLGPPN